jgi:hypothetical protein
MLSFMRRVAITLPFGLVTAIVTHLVRFGDDHEFGGEANEAIVTLATVGALTIALVLLHRFLVAGTTTPTGTLARARIARLLPHSALVFAVAAFTYYGIESLEGHGIELGFATIVLAAVAALVAAGLRLSCALLATFVARAVCALVALLAAQPRPQLALAVARRPLHVEPERVARRFGRAPPPGR